MYPENAAASCWEREYAQKGRVWGGAVHNLPPLGDGQRVLELGCGDGKILSALLERGCTVVGADISSSAISLCRSQVRDTARSEFLRADACCLPFDPASFDAVTAFHIVGHLGVQERREAAEEIARVLRPGGILWFSDFSREDFRAGKGREKEPWTFERKNGIATHYFSEDEVRSLFGGLFPEECSTRCWTMRVRGRDYRRGEIVGCFTKIVLL